MAEAPDCPGGQHGENHPELSPEAEVGLPILGTWRAQLCEMRPAPGPVPQQTLWCGRRVVAEMPQLASGSPADGNEVLPFSANSWSLFERKL